jgi:hypothetical protein
MANEIAVTPADIRLLSGPIPNRAVADGALAFGDSVYISGYSNNRPKVAKCDGTAVAKALCYGIVVAGDPANPGETSVADGELCDIAVVGSRVAGYTGATAGGKVWVSDTVGRLSSVVGTKSGFIGVMETPNVLFVMPGLYVIST